MSFIVSGIHTGIGKTICSAVLCEALGFDYWKPVQAGELENTDSHTIKRLTSTCEIFPERYQLSIAASPHYAANEEGIEIKLSDFDLPLSDKRIIVETAGGILSPLSETITNLDLMAKLQLPNILVSNNYLGSINHTMLTIEVLESRGIKTVGIIFCGDEIPATRTYIDQHTKIPILCSVPQFRALNHTIIKEFATTIEIDIKTVLNDN